MKSIEIDKDIIIMEICGTHTMSILRSGIKKILPSNIKLISGPGCPVCVTNQGYIDVAIELSKREDIIITTFGDMINIPGTKESLKIRKALGSDIRVVYSPLEAINIAKKNPNKEVVFLGIGFETTAPTIALTIKKGHDLNLKNFSVFSSLKTMPEVIKMLLKDKEVKVDGIICPGHVSTIIGEKDFYFISDELNIPAVISGFDDKDVMAAIYLLIDMIKQNKYNFKNIYGRFVKYNGNEKAKELMSDVFKVSNSIWRGIGLIENSGLAIDDKYSEYNAEIKFSLKIEESVALKGCICGEILQGKKTPVDCSFFGKQCTPNNPIGVCMVSREGCCGVYYRYSDKI
ncbi:hydrogenase expression/formation protein HypD [Clostridium cavendishii DSM 21758]|uniref:Hydrogenase expression/formation protein HypD n=1 Tax=Clostridium cavendishii DSM 21758 TaxID=1121302 RepID=A0A1M6HX75_9CLOT|nr:hydrogenase formation protein HypD [Clostridium cavendishii]SHJ26849.1 hydrogenase expression/formation protein HypD [Clostridium cavendishii DSM 21758]